jgi:nitrogen fixation protein NifU and related proteins
MQDKEADRQQSRAELEPPSNMGRMNDSNGSARTKGLCGDTMEMYLTIKDNRIEKALFHTDGCSASRACGSTAARLAAGKTLSEVLRLSPADVLDAWADLPQGNIHCSILAVGTLHKAVADYLLRKQDG